jgi:hypothetical protein
VLFSISVFSQKKYITGSIPRGEPVLRSNPVSPDGKIIIPCPFIIRQKVRSETVIGNTYYDTQAYNSGNLMNWLIPWTSLNEKQNSVEPGG